MRRRGTGGGPDGGAEDAPRASATLEEAAAELFVRRSYGDWSPDDQAAFERRLASDSAFAAACGRVEASWAALDAHAEAPELIAHRAEAITALRRSGARRWRGRAAGPVRRRTVAVAAALAALAVAGLAWRLSPLAERPGEYRTGLGERRVVELEDRSRIVLDASTVLRVDYSTGAREVRIEEGQAQFTVAKDPMRPFRVRAGDHTIVALGTVFTVEYVDRAMHVAMMEGRVAVVPRQEPAAAGTPGKRPDAWDASTAAGSAAGVELSAGQDLRIARDGRSTLNVDADLDAATAWLQGRIIFRAETLGEAVRRFNRYSRVRIEVEDASLAARRISGVFEAGDAMGFVDAVQRYLPASAERTDAGTVVLSPRQPPRQQR